MLRRVRLGLSRVHNVLDFSDEAATHYAHVRADLKKRGQMIGANDLFIAAHARSLGLTLVTNNTAELDRVKGLRVENWTTRRATRLASFEKDCRKGPFPL